MAEYQGIMAENWTATNPSFGIGIKPCALFPDDESVYSHFAKCAATLPEEQVAVTLLAGKNKNMQDGSCHQEGDAHCPREAQDAGKQTISFSELSWRVDALARGIQAGFSVGTNRKNTFGVLTSSDSIRQPEIMLAALRSGSTYVAINAASLFQGSFSTLPARDTTCESTLKETRIAPKMHSGPENEGSINHSSSPRSSKDDECKHQETGSTSHKSRLSLNNVNRALTHH